MNVQSVLPLALLAASLSGAAQAAAPAAAAPLMYVPAAQLNDLECRAKVSPYTCSIAAAELELVHGRAAPVHSALSDEDTLAPAAKPGQVRQELPAPVPEPQTFVMMMLGLVLLGFASARREMPEKFGD